MLDSMQREELDVVLSSDVRDVFNQLRYQPLSDLERSLIASSIEELVRIRHMLSVGTDTSGAAVGD